jgi:uncharacterized repeat protein (TIGR01451 family)
MKKLSLLLLLMITVSCSSYAQSVSFSLTTAPCNNNGVLQATSSGLSGTVTYTFYGMGGGPLATNTTGTLNNYTGGPIYVNASNGIGYASNYYAGAPPFNYTYTTITATCPALSTASVTVSGGTAPYTVLWRLNGTTTTVATGATVSLPANYYDVFITDANGCTYGSYAKYDSIQVSNNSPVNFSVAGTAASCTNGTATITGLSGGTAPYSYLWSNSATSSALTGLVRGYYTVKVADANGCNTTRAVNISQTPNITVNTTVSPATCIMNNGSATAFGSGGVGPYTYLWSNTQTTQLASGLAGGNYYYVTATDANGCTGQAGAYINISTPITATSSATSSSCTSPTGTATVVPSGGTTPYTIVWNSFPVQTGTTATALAPGLYNFTITDAVGCKRTGSVNVPPVSVINASAFGSNTMCSASNGSASVSVSSGAPPYTYLWSNSATSSSITGLPSGSYSVQITDNMGCKVIKQAYVGVNSPVNVGLSTTRASCIFTSDGSITATATGGTPPYTYFPGNTVSSLPTGNYSVSVIDAAGCTGSAFGHVSYNAANTSCYCTVTGTVYNDLNRNCTKDPGEAGIPNIMMHLSGLGYAYTNGAGMYSFKATTGSYTLSQVVQGYYPLAPCQSNAVSVSVTAASACSTVVNFADTMTTIHDMQVHTLSLGGPPVPGNSYYQVFIVKNNGTVSESNILGGYRHDGQLGAPTVPSTLSLFSTRNYRSNSSFPSISPAAIHTSLMQYTVPTNIPINTDLVFDDSATHTAPMTNWLNDYSPWDNVHTYNSSVMGSFDPNNKEVSPSGQGSLGFITTNDSILTYTINFQNTGNYPAQKVVLIDTLDSDLEVQTLKPFAASHKYTASVTDGSGIVTFTFDNINLPDSNTDKLGSMGYVVFKVSQKPKLAVGTQILNSASIYFDYNAPVKTNTTINTIVEKTSGVPGTGKPEELMATVYPNPASDRVTIAIDADGLKNVVQVKLLSLTGQVMQHQQVSLKAGRNLFEANTANLAPGMYFIEVTDGTRLSTTKLSIVR